MDDQNKNLIQPQTTSPPSGVSALFAEPPETPLGQDLFGDSIPNPNVNVTEAPVIHPAQPTVFDKRMRKMPKISGRAWLSVAVSMAILGGGGIFVLRHQNTPAPTVSSQSSSTASQSSIGKLNEQSVTFNIDTKVAGGKTLTATGPVIVQNNVNSANAFSVQNAAGSTLFVADTTDNKIGIGAAPTGSAILQVAGDVSISGNIAASGAVSADSGATTLSNNGLTINNVLICTSSGCKNLAAQAASGQVFTGDASTLSGQPGSYYRDASNVNGGTLSDARLSSNVALLSSTQTYTGINSFTSAGNVFVGDGSSLSAVNAAKLNGQGASYYQNASNISSGTLGDSRLSGNITKAGNTFNGLSELVMLDSSGLLPALDASALTNLDAGAVSIGTISDSHLSVNVTLAGNSFNGASQLVKLNASGDIPALSGINLTNLNASVISGGTLNDLRLSPNVTLQGNTFNGASQLVQTTSQSYFPALNGSLITNLDAGNIASGALSDNRLSANVALLGAASQTFSGSETFSNIITAPGLETTNAGHNITLGFSGVATGDVAYNFDVTAAPGTYSICTSAGNCPGPSGGVTSTGGTVNHLAKFNGAQTIIDSIISDNGSTVTINGDLAANNITQNSNAVCDVSGNCAGVGGQVGGTGTSNKIALFSGTSTIGDSIIGQSGTTISVGGNLNITGQYQLNGAQVSSSVLSDAANLALLNGNQTLSGNNLFTGNLQVQPASDSTTALLVTNHAGSSNVLTVDTTNGRVGVGVQPGYTLDVAGDINISSGSSYRINGVAICGPSATCAPASGSGNYIQNSVSQQTNANINIQSVNSGSIVALFKGATSQTADLIRAQDGNGNNVFHVDPAGNVNIPGQYQINGSPICTTSGCTSSGDVGGSGYYIQNGTSPQVANYNITGNGTVGGNLLVGYSSITSGVAVFSGNVGIGTASPTNGELDVEGYGNGVGIYVTGNGTAIHGDSGSSYGVQGTSIASVGGYFSSTAGYALVTGTGNVGIGTSSPGSKLEVSGTTTLHPNVIITDVPEGGIYQTVLSLQSTQVPRLQFASNSATPYAEINSYANGGYGLDVATLTGLPLLLSTNNVEKVRIQASSGKDVLSIADSGAQNSGITIGGDTNLYRSAANLLKTDDNLQVALNLGIGYDPTTITGGVAAFNGNVGIGTPTPGQKLEVNGNIRLASSSSLSFGATDSIKLQDGGSNALNIYTSSTLQASVDASGNFTLSGNGLLVLGVKTSDPSCTNGSIYYNSSSSSFRGCAGGSWNDFAIGAGQPAGTIMQYAGSTAPTGYFIADGSAVSRVTYASLFAVIGTTYGAGDGSTTFNLPDLRGRVTVGLGTNADDNSLGANDGSALANRTPRHNSTFNSPSISRTADVTLNDPGHSHSIYNFFGGGVTQSGALCGCNNGGGTTSTNSSLTGITVSQQPNFALSGGSVGPGGSRPTDTPAYITLNYIIKY